VRWMAFVFFVPLPLPQRDVTYCAVRCL
jgi:hypothetical protein